MIFLYLFCYIAVNLLYQTKKEPISVEEKDEFDALVDSNAKPLEHRLGTSPEKLEKKVSSKKGRYSVLGLACILCILQQTFLTMYTLTIVNRIEAIDVAI